MKLKLQLNLVAVGTSALLLACGAATSPNQGTKQSEVASANSPFGSRELQSFNLTNSVSDALPSNCAGSGCWRDFVPATPVWFPKILVTVEGNFPVRLSDKIYFKCENGKNIELALPEPLSALSLTQKVSNPCGFSRIAKVTLTAGFDGVPLEGSNSKVVYTGSIF